MSNYNKTTNFTIKDNLPTGNPSKIIRGNEIDDELDNIQNAVNSKADKASPTFTGVVTAPTVNVTGTLTANLIDGGTY